MCSKCSSVGTWIQLLQRRSSCWCTQTRSDLHVQFCPLKQRHWPRLLCFLCWLFDNEGAAKKRKRMKPCCSYVEGRFADTQPDSRIADKPIIRPFVTFAFHFNKNILSSFSFTTLKRILEKNWFDGQMLQGSSTSCGVALCWSHLHVNCCETEVRWIMQRADSKHLQKHLH